MKRTRLKVKQFNKELEQNNYKLQFSKKDAIEKAENKEEQLTVILINKVVAFFYHQKKLVPTLKFLQSHIQLLKKITVDMGAIKFVAGGADIMRPGITNIEENIEVGDILAIVDETHGKAICIGKSLLSSKDMQIQQKGKSLENIHYINDNIWKMS